MITRFEAHSMARKIGGGLGWIGALIVVVSLVFAFFGDNDTEAMFWRGTALAVLSYPVARLIGWIIAGSLPPDPSEPSIGERLRDLDRIAGRDPEP